MLRELVLKTRSYRRFYQNKKVSFDSLKDMVATARLSASAGNLQPLCYVLCNGLTTNDKIFSTLGWAAYLKDWKGPEKGERPSAYIIILADKNRGKNFECDLGIAAQTIMLAATEQGLGGCMIGSINKHELGAILKLEEQYDILLVLALGQPKETVILDHLNYEGSIKYYRDEKGAHHVPKRSLGQIIVNTLGE